MYDEYKGTKYADVPDYIGDQGKLEGIDDESTEVDLTPKTEMRKHLENIVRAGDFQ